MNEQLQMLAEYNQKTNQEMMQVLEGVPPERLTGAVGSYFGSVMGILNHVLISDTTWLRRLAGALAPLAFLTARLAHLHYGSNRDVLFNRLADFRAARFDIDGLFRQALQALPDEQYDRVLQYRNTRGQEQQKRVGHLFLHLFNHQTHHRGQVSLILDQWGVDNDYSNLISKF
jgi:uncharacterized damage-inducible protein DinB